MLKAPGFGGIPIHHQLKTDTVFTHGAGGTEGYSPPLEEETPPWSTWEQFPRLTAREISMIQLMDSITDKKDWNIDILDQAVVKAWWEEASKAPLTSEKAWEWCIAELKDKAALFMNQQNVHVVVLDTGSCVFKSDTAVEPGIWGELQRYSEAIRREITTKDAPDQSHLIDPSLFPLVLGITSVMIEGGRVDLKNILGSHGHGATSPYHPPHPVIYKRRPPAVKRIFLSVV